jgi:uncharacterized protein (DUF488 family)
VPASSVPDLLTFGHGTATEGELVDLLRDAGVQLVVDVRRFPGSRRHPHVAREELEQWLPASQLRYRWEVRLGGRRAAPAGADELDTWWQVPAFRAYASHMRTEEFRAALGELLADVAEQGPGRTAVMCSESLWWRCHRRLISDAVVLLHGHEVGHLGHDGRVVPHVPSAGARVSDAGDLRYDR